MVRPFNTRWQRKMRLRPFTDLAMRPSPTTSGQGEYQRLFVMTASEQEGDICVQGNEPLEGWDYVHNKTRYEEHMIGNER
jgi:hypothetical protein